MVERLSTGAIGAVYKALDTVLDHPVAVKCIRLDTSFADRFRQASELDSEPTFWD